MDNINNDIQSNNIQDSEKIKNTFKNSFFVESEDIKEHIFYLKDFLPIPEDYVTLLYGAGGVGKSLLALQLCVRYILETQNYAFYWNTELTRKTIFYRFNKIVELLELKEEDKKLILNKLIIYTKSAYNEAQSILKSLYQLKIKFIIFDPFISFLVFSKGSKKKVSTNITVRRYLDAFSNYAKQSHSSIIFTHNKDNNIVGGSYIILNSVNVCYLLEPISNKQNSPYRKIKLIRDNIGIADLYKNRDLNNIAILPLSAKDKKYKCDINNLNNRDSYEVFEL